MKLILLLCFTTPLTILANDADEIDRNRVLRSLDINQLSSQEINELPEIHSTSESFIQDRDTKSGVLKDAFYTGSDSTRYSASFLLSYDYEDLTKITSFDLTFLKKFERSYLNLWWGLNLKSTLAKYEAIADERETSSHTDSAANFTRTGEIQGLTYGGFALAYRFKTLDRIFNTNRLFDMTKVSINYVINSDPASNDLYNGYGYSAEYTLEYRSGSSFFYGLKLDYNWIFVERAQVSDEGLADRSLVYGWSSLGAELGYYF